MRTFDQLVASTEAAVASFEGWDFSAISDRVEREPTPWDYTALVNDLAARASSFVDLGTGGGEFLAGVAPRPPLTVATEGWLPNVPVAGRRLSPLGIRVVGYAGTADNAVQTAGDDEASYPFLDASFDVVVDRHEAFRASEVARVLRRGGTFLTQQVGALDCIELCEALGGVHPGRAPTVDDYVAQLTAAGLDVRVGREARPAKRFADSAALLYYVLAVPWAFVGFSLETHRERLEAIHAHVEADGGFTVHEHRLLFEASKP